MITLLGMLPEELTGLALSIGMPKFAGRQLADWIYNKRVTSFDEMTNISLRHRALLQEKVTIGRKAPVARA
ncbi:MAG: 23S rRNA (adenine(2503)-C(2))-methyltransferase RlmN, partial [Porphyromonas endodontalis]